MESALQPRPNAIFRDPFSGFSHLVAAIASVAGLVLLIFQALDFGDTQDLVGFIIFGSGMIMMFLASAIYHLYNGKSEVIVHLKRLDHIAIFIMIAGGYTPLCLSPLRDDYGYALLSSVWGVAIVGILLKVFWLHAPRILSTGIYLFLGWACVFAVYPMLNNMTSTALWWMLAGGLSYSFGAIVYGTKKPDPWPGIFGFHEIWHLFVIGGAFCHFWAIAFHII